MQQFFIRFLEHFDIQYKIKSAIENHENTTVSAAVFRPAVNISDVIIKAGKCGKNINNVVNQLFKDKCHTSHFSPFLLLFCSLKKGLTPFLFCPNKWRSFGPLIMCLNHLFKTLTYTDL